MEHDPPELQRLLRLISTQLEGDLTDGDRRELTELLRDNEAAQRLYVESIEDTTSLRWWSADADFDAHRDAVASLAPATQPARSNRRWVGWATLAASVAVVITAGSMLWPDRQPVLAVAHPESESPVESIVPDARDAKPIAAKVATLTRLRGVRWADGKNPVAEMSRLTVGQVLWLRAGEAEIFFDKAVQLVVRGPASIEIRSPMEIYSSYGIISARVGESGKGFTIQTPTGRITDLGTEFGVAIGEQGGTDVAVFRGAVDLAYGMQDLSVNTRLNQGQALHLGSDGSLRRLVAIDNHRFPSVHGGPGPLEKGSALIIDVHDNIRDGVGAKFYRIVPGGLFEDVPAYVDRQHQWNGIDASGIPEFLLGADYVMPFNEDKYAPTLEVTVTIGQPTTLFVFLSNIVIVPDWLKADFEDTGLKIGLDEHAEFSNPAYELGIGPGDKVDTEFAIWKRDIPTPTNVTLGSVRQIPRSGWGFCMYGIAAIPLDAPQPP